MKAGVSWHYQVFKHFLTLQNCLTALHCIVPNFFFADCCLSYSWEYSCRTSCDSWLSLFEKYLIWLTKNLKWNECLLMDVSRMEIDGRKPFQLFWRQEAARMSWLCELCIEGSLHTPPSTHGAEHHVNNAHTFYTFIYFHVVLAFCNVWLTWS